MGGAQEGQKSGGSCPRALALAPPANPPGKILKVPSDTVWPMPSCDLYKTSFLQDNTDDFLRLQIF